MNGAAFKLIGGTIRVHDFPTITRNPNAPTEDAFACFNFRDHRGISASILVARIGNAKAETFARLTPLPTGHGCHFFQDGTATRIIQMPQAVGKWIFTHQRRHFIHDTFHRPDIQCRPQAAQRRCTDGHFQ